MFSQSQDSFLMEHAYYIYEFFLSQYACPRATLFIFFSLHKKMLNLLKVVFHLLVWQIQLLHYDKQNVNDELDLNVLYVQVINQITFLILSSSQTKLFHTWSVSFVILILYFFLFMSNQIKSKSIKSN